MFISDANLTVFYGQLDPVFFDAYVMIFNISKKCLCKMNRSLFYAFIISFWEFSSCRVITSTKVLQPWCSKIHYFSTLMLKNLTLFTIAFCVFEHKIYKFNLPTAPPSLLSPSFYSFWPPSPPPPFWPPPTQNILSPLPSFNRARVRIASEHFAVFACKKLEDFLIHFADFRL